MIFAVNALTMPCSPEIVEPTVTCMNVAGRTFAIDDGVTRLPGTSIVMRFEMADINHLDFSNTPGLESFDDIFQVSSIEVID